MAFFIREWVDLPNAPYVPKVIALKSMSSFLSLIIFYRYLRYMYLPRPPARARTYTQRGNGGNPASESLEMGSEGLSATTHATRE